MSDKTELLKQLGFSEELIEAIEHYNPLETDFEISSPEIPYMENIDTSGVFDVQQTEVITSTLSVTFK